MSGDEILKFNSVDISFEGKTVIHDVNFCLHEGEILALVGESGSGKSSIIKAAMGLLSSNGKVSNGEILFKGKNLLKLSEKEFRTLRGSELGMIFQDTSSSLCPVHKIGYQICESFRAHGKITTEEAKQKAFELFKKLNFSDVERVWNSYPFELSGGMNQRVGIAISMLLNPPVLFADEPTSALDVVAQRQVVQEMLSVRKMFGTSIVIVSHDLGVVSSLADTVLVLKKGRAVEYGAKNEVLENPKDEYTKQLLDAVPRLKTKDKSGAGK